MVFDSGTAAPEKAQEPVAGTEWDSDGGRGDTACLPIAIVGLSGRFPGSATDPSGLWDMLLSGRTAWTPGPGRRRFNMKAFQELSGNRAGTTTTGGAHFLREDIAAFDANFFGIHAVEATAMDPQQRLQLEVAYEAFENAGMTMDALWGSQTGVYVGQWAQDYHESVTRDPQHPPSYLVTGTGAAMTSNRISHFFNLHAPSFTVDTGCSASMVALHQAVQSLRAGETTQCFVGGVNLLLDPQRFTYGSQMKMVSREGRSFSFDARATGYGRGECCAGVVLKPLSAALRDGDPVRAVIRNSVLNQDGRTPGITVPSAKAQREAIWNAYQQANLDTHADYVEAHGTGTKVGDPIEASAIAAVLGQHRRPECALPIGSIKGNIGHTESAAGLAGLIKAVLMLEHGIIPAQANYQTCNPDIPLENWGLRIPVRAEKPDVLGRISVNSFGYGGTNAHIVVDSLDKVISHLSPSPACFSVTTSSTQKLRVFVISAASEKACQRACLRLARYLVLDHAGHRGEDDWLARVAYTLGNKRSTHRHQVALVASTVDDLVTQLMNAAHSPIPEKERKASARIALVFGGQGAQYPRMGCDLLQAHPVFAQSLERAREQLFRLGCPWDLISELRREEADSRINDPALSQPLTTAIQLALVDTLSSFGVFPCAVVGHSSGEIAATYAAHAISLEDAMTAAYFRGQLTSKLITEDLQSSPGGMMAVGAAPAVVEQHIRRVGTADGSIGIACYNSPSSVTVSGDSAAIDRLKHVLDEEGIFNRKLSTNGAAYHSHHMERIKEAYESSLKALPAGTVGSSVRMFSTVTGKALDQKSLIDGHYWTQNLTSPVLFSQAFSSMCQQEFNGLPVDTLIEVGPHSQLAGPVKETLRALRGSLEGINYTHTLLRGAQDAAVTFLQCLTFLHISNGTVNLNDLNQDGPPAKPLVDLPPYPFDHDRTYWHKSRLSETYRHRPHVPHELLGTLSLDVNSLEPKWRHFLSLKECPWLRNHRVQGQIVFPAAGYITMAVQAIRQHIYNTDPTSHVHSVRLRDISFGKALALSEDDPGPGQEICLSLRPQARSARESSSIWSEFRIFTVDSEQSWTEHCRGLIRTEADPVNEHYPLGVTPDDAKRIDKQCKRLTDPRKFYQIGDGVGLGWRSPFESLCAIRTSRHSTHVSVRVPNLPVAPGGMGDWLSPPALDAALFQSGVSLLFLEDGLQSPCMPVFVKQLRIANRSTEANTELVCAAKSCNNSKPSSILDVRVQQHSGGTESPVMVLEAEGIRLKTLPGAVADSRNSREICHGMEWVAWMDDKTTAHHCRDRCQAVVPSGSFAEQDRILNALALGHIQRALEEVPNPADIPDGYLRHQFAWMKTVAGRGTSHFGNSHSEIEMACLDLDLGPVGDVIARLGPHLSSILTCRTDPLSLLSQDNLLSRLYSTDDQRRCYSQMAAYCLELGRQASGLRVLEIGAGTASTTILILQALRKAGRSAVHQYDFTDISPGFFSAAKERLGDLADVVEFTVLDIERDPIKQGFAEGSYDLIIATNVIHATKHIDRTLRHVHSVLRPGGRFMMMEVTRETLYCNLVFGTLPGWWSGHDDGRTVAPTLTGPEWLRRLQQADFANAEVWFRDYEEDDGGKFSVFIAEAPSSSQSTADGTPLPTLRFVTTDANLSRVTSTDSKRWLHLLERELDTSQGSISAHSLLMSAPEEGIVIMLPEVAQQLCRSPDPKCWEQFKRWVLQVRTVLFVSISGTDSADEAETGLWAGLARTLHLEHADIRAVTLDLRCGPEQVLPKLVKVLPRLLRSATFDQSRLATEVEDEFAEEDDRLLVARAFHRPDISDYVRRVGQHAEAGMVPFLGTGRPLTAELAVPGLLETLRWKDDLEAPELGPDDVRLELRAASINFKDVLIAAGQLESYVQLRNDCSGVVLDVGANMRDRFRPGDRVCALYSRAYTNYPVVHGDCCHVVPDAMSFAEAASLPIVGTTVYYCLIDKARLRNGDKILVHSAAGAVGQAAISLAQHIGAEVFATAGNEAKREFLQRRFGLAAGHIYSSRTTAFAGRIKQVTDGYGVDVVLNSLGGEAFRESTNLVAPFGRFIEIGRKDLEDDALMPIEFLLRNVTFAYVDFSIIIEQDKALARRLLKSVVSLTATGSIQPVSLTTMPISEIERAFRQIQKGDHIGKIILTVEKDQQVKAIPPVPPPAELRPDASYLVVGGFGGLGRAMLSWMADHGARYLISFSRSGAVDPRNHDLISELEARGVHVLAKAGDVASSDDVASLTTVPGRSGFPPVRGIIQSGMVLQDALLGEMTCEDWQAALTPKVRGSLHLHHILGQDIDFFISLSSIVAMSGNIGQSNYAAACSVQDALARYRRAHGLPGYSINVGWVLDAGYVSENPQTAATLRRQGFSSSHLSELLALIEYAVTDGGRDDGNCVCSIGLAPSHESLPSSGSVNQWFSQRRFAHLVRPEQTQSKMSGSSVDVSTLLSKTSCFEDAVEVVCQTLLERLGRLLATPVESLSAAKSLDQYGVDSLVAVELHNWIIAYLRANITLVSVRGASSIYKLAQMVTKESALVPLDALRN
ncbi:lovastatin nonaketide synthase [Aspergillus udagawae]|uniref:Lovastatin nonaketide synthase n=1 Tax=Aspergillus udagawae TaxID=91492 RepID=A0ABQ1BBE1_9EURO|nr:lovastatin nonaketide synthase [Aspergillus udagawae]GFG17038.1 lovastatin nonaketide synthase [Aspergillus udagawae]